MGSKNEALSIYKQLSLTPVSSAKDLVGCKPMMVRINEGQRQDILKMLTIALDKCTMAMGFETSNERLVLLATDILEAYKYDSTEDIIEALKQGRQLLLERPPHASRSKFSMEYVAHWMEQILKQKAEAREIGLRNKFKEKQEPLEDIDYAAYKVRVEEERKSTAGQGRHANIEMVRKQAQNVIDAQKEE